VPLPSDLDLVRTSRCLVAQTILAMAFLAAEAVSPAAAPRDQIHATEFRGLYACVVDRVLAGPDGEVAVWWGDDRQILGTSTLAPGEIVIGRMHDPPRKADDRLYVYGGGGRAFYPVRWSGRDGRLFIRTRGPESRILTVDADGGAAREVAELGPAWRRISIDAIGHGNVDALLRPQATERAKRVDGEALIRGHATIGAGLEMVGARRSDMELVRIGDSSTADIGLNAGHTRSLTLFSDSTSYPAGIAYLGAPSRLRPGYRPYQLPLVDQSTGRTAGKFGPTGILLEGRSRLSRTLASFQRLRGGSRIILDASLSGQTLMALTLSGRGNRAIVRIGPAGLSEKPICTDVVVSDLRRRTSPNPLVSTDTDYRPLFRAFTLDALGREGAQPGRPVLTLHSLGKGSSKDAILHFHGGPGASSADSDFRLSQLAALLEPTRDIVSVEYSGSIGGGSALTRRLGDRGIASLREDSDAIVRWLNRRNYRRVFIVASSFGSVPALVALEQHRQRFPAAFFFAPLLRLPEPQEHADRGKFDSVSGDTQLSYERALLGGRAGRERFKAELAALVKRAPLRASDHFYFAERDPVSRPSDLPPGTAATHEVMPRTNHMVIFAVPEAWRAIEEQIR
jgi:pimeloyl-ACP methyl ester carboxylesterase